MKVYVLDISILDNKALFDELYSGMPVQRKEKIDRFKPVRSKQLSLGAGWLIKYALKDIGHPELNGCITVDENGKPYINDEVFFNLSHSGTKVMCVISDSPVGCDIQIMDKAAEGKLAEYAFSQEEFNYVLSGDTGADDNSAPDPDENESPEDAVKDRFYRIWTMKEAYTKYLGLGLKKEFKSFSVLEMTGHFLEYKTGNYRMAVYADSISADIDPETVDIEERGV